MLEFTRQKTGMDDEYKKVLESYLILIRANGRIKQTLNEQYQDLHRRQLDFLDVIQNKMTEFSLEERALHEIDDNWNVKEYWGNDF